MVPSQGIAGQVYGTTSGPNGSYGSIFSVSSTGKVSQPYTFGNDGTNPYAGLTLATDGNFYGTTLYGGASGNGVLFRLSPSGSYAVLHEFAGGTDGAFPTAPPIQASDGSLYGTTTGVKGASTIYKYSTASYSTLYDLSSAEGQYAVAR